MVALNSWLFLGLGFGIIFGSVSGCSSNIPGANAPRSPDEAPAPAPQTVSPTPPPFLVPSPSPNQSGGRSQYEISNSMPAAAGTYGGCGHSFYWNSGEPSLSTDGAGIVGGVDAKQNEYPYQARIFFKYRRSSVCGASIISSTFALTAAHCCMVVVSPDDILLVVGDHNKVKQDVGERNATVVEIIIHPNYSDATQTSDFCLLRLDPSAPLPWSRYVQPVCLPTSCSQSCATNDLTVITGWGALDEIKSDQGLTPDIIQKARVAVVDQNTCKAAYSNQAQPITDDMVCAGYQGGGIDTCQGDSGGPMVCYKNGFYQLDGVTSFGIGCARQNYYGVYAKVCRSVNWINSVMASDYTTTTKAATTTTTTTTKAASSTSTVASLAGARALAVGGNTDETITTTTTRRRRIVSTVTTTPAADSK